jgi:hypothetical protein
MEMEHTGGGRTRMMLDEGNGKMKIYDLEDEGWALMLMLM